MWRVACGVWLPSNSDLYREMSNSQAITMLVVMVVCVSLLCVPFELFDPRVVNSHGHVDLVGELRRSGDVMMNFTNETASRPNVTQRGATALFRPYVKVTNYTAVTNPRISEFASNKSRI